MKRILSIFLVLALVCGCALAEDEPGFFESFGRRLDEFFADAGEKIAGAWDSASEVIGEAWDTASEAVSEAWDTASEAVSSAWDTASGAVSGAWQSAVDFTRQHIDAIRESLKQYQDRPEGMAAVLRPYYVEAAVKSGLSEEDASAQWDALVAFAQERGLNVGHAYVMAGGAMIDAAHDGSLQDFSPVEWLTAHGYDDPQALSAAAEAVLAGNSEPEEGSAQ